MDYYTGNYFLNMEEMKVNATFIYNSMSADGWTLEAISGMLGNMQSESSINPGIWQSLDAQHPEPWGFGLVQWTPSTKYTDWCRSKGLTPEYMESAISRINYELANGLQWIKTTAYPLTFQEFKESKESPYYLGLAFLKNYERPADPDQPQRGTQAEFWYEYLSGFPPIPPRPTKGKKLPIYYYLKKF